jgi:DNA-binding transcriptional regulator YiaG
MGYRDLVYPICHLSYPPVTVSFPPAFLSRFFPATITLMTHSDAPVTVRHGRVIRLSRRDLTVIMEARASLADGTARLARLAAGVKVTEIASVLDVTSQAVSNWESGRRVPDASHALAYVRAMAAAVR